MKRFWMFCICMLIVCLFVVQAVFAKDHSNDTTVWLSMVRGTDPQLANLPTPTPTPEPSVRRIYVDFPSSLGDVTWVEIEFPYGIERAAFHDDIGPNGVSVTVMTRQIGDILSITGVNEPASYSCVAVFSDPTGDNGPRTITCGLGLQVSGK